MDRGPRSKRWNNARFAPASFDSPCAFSPQRIGTLKHHSFRAAENSSKAIAGQAITIVHTGGAFGPTAQKLPKIKTARAIG
jgi:hypothetical protein